VKIKTRDIFFIAGAILLLVMIYLFIKENERSNRLERIAARAIGERDYYKKSYLNQLETKLIETDAPHDLLKELEGLKVHFENVDTQIHKQINTVMNLLTDGYKEKAIFDLSKVIENILKHSYEKVENTKCKMKFYKLLEYAVKHDWISQEEHQFAKAIKKIRNNEGHQLNSEVDLKDASTAILSGVKIIYHLPKLSSLSPLK